MAHTEGHGDSMTNSTQWGRVGENIQHYKTCLKTKKYYLLLKMIMMMNSNIHSNNNEREKIIKMTQKK